MGGRGEEEEEEEKNMDREKKYGLVESSLRLKFLILNEWMVEEEEIEKKKKRKKEKLEVNVK